MKNKALLMLENGYYDYGELFTGSGNVFGEFVFNTAMSGYEEILTDPSGKGQVITFTYPLIGNYGVSKLNLQSDKIYANAVVINDLSAIPSNHQSIMTFADFLNEFDIPGITGIDTRSLTRQIRMYGAINGGITNQDISPEEFLKIVKAHPSISEFDLYKQVINKDVKIIDGNTDSDLDLVVIDFGVKLNILNHLKQNFRKLYLVPFDDNFDKNISELEFDGVFLTNGPGDPRSLKESDKYILDFAKNGIPVIGICFGHQLIGKAFNLDIVKLPFGHHGGNHPVKELESGKVFITAQSHNYAVSLNSIENNPDWELTWLHLYDNTVSGMRHKHLPINSVQFHPEASPGPNDAGKIVFDNFYNTVKLKNG
ncbi:MAG TPA: glutamine-hydrolyzing carbamoyl-phosphate synthase small subunit [Candidatus Kapabacteria bacterium]|nr:glutamine-hydrolyzing carbamoyl-phosphate synthase small subunit [Candidatus Kapabacteria bacterium]